MRIIYDCSVITAEKPHKMPIIIQINSKLLSIVIYCFCLAFVTCAEEETDNGRFNCYPDGFPNSTLCEQRNCVYKSPVDKTTTGIPWCFYNTLKSRDGYNVTNIVYSSDGTTDYTIEKYDTAHDTYQAPLKDVEVKFVHQSKNCLRVKFSDANDRSRYEVPVGKGFAAPSGNSTEDMYYVETVLDPFSFKIKRKGSIDGAIWDTSVGLLMLYDQYLQISTKLSTPHIYGFGEHEHDQFQHDMNWKTHGMFARDQWVTLDANLYGVHPFYMGIEDDGKAYGVLLLNSNAMDVTMQPLPALTYRTIGGVLDFYFFFGPTSEMVVQQYTELIGRPFMPPYWSLGFQLCRYGYNHIDVVKDTVARMQKYSIPLDIQYGDIDYMDRQLDFTYDNVTYKGLPDFVRQLKKDGIHYITILDPAISASEYKGTYKPYELGNALGIWVKDENGTEAIVGKVWPDLPNVTVNESKNWDEQVKLYRAPAVYPDFFHKDIDKWWSVLINEFHKTLEFDGLWIDMNEPANFVHGSINGCSRNKYDNPEFRPKLHGSVLADKTLCMDAKHYDGVLHYDYHSLYGWSQAAPTQRAAQLSTKKRSVVISRSTYVSSGVWAGHWLGDNESTWPHLRRSIIGMMEFNLFGIPYVGADICGFNRNTTVPLCRRWMQLGAFYPFSRNHNGLGYIPQDPAVFGEAFAKGSADVLSVRYSLLPYLYTLFYESHTMGSTVVRPMMHEFIKDKVTWKIDRQFLWGKALLITPVLDETTTVKGYFPDAFWYDFYTGERMEKSGDHVSLDAAEWHIPLHVRGGNIIPMQLPGVNTVESRTKDMSLLIAYCKDGKAKGSLFWDDGDTIDTIKLKQYQLIEFSSDMNHGLNLTMLENGIAGYAAQFKITSLKIFGLGNAEISSVTVNGVENGKATGNGKMVEITGISLTINKDYKIQWQRESKPSNANQLQSAICVIISMLITQFISHIL